MFWPEEVSVGEVVYPPGGRLGPRLQRNLQLVIVHTGHMNVWIDDQHYHAPPASITILFPSHEERFAFAEDSETWHSWLHVYASDIPAALMQRLEALPRVLPLSPMMNNLMRLALTLRESLIPTLPETMNSLALLMLWQFVGEGELQQTGERIVRSHLAVEHAKAYIQNHMTDSLTLSQIAQAVAVTPAHLIRLFRSDLKTTPMNYVWEKRVTLGVELLERTGLPVGVIAERCGFRTSYHFSRRVRQITGLSPSEIRKRSWS